MTEEALHKLTKSVVAMSPTDYESFLGALSDFANSRIKNEDLYTQCCDEINALSRWVGFREKYSIEIRKRLATIFKCLSEGQQWVKPVLAPDELAVLHHLIEVGGEGGVGFLKDRALIEGYHPELVEQLYHKGYVQLLTRRFMVVLPP